MGRFDGSAGLQWPALIDEYRWHYRRCSQQRHVTGGKSLLHLEPCWRFATLSLNRQAFMHRGPPAQLSRGRTPRRRPLGGADRLSIRRHHRWISLQRQDGVAAVLRSWLSIWIWQWKH